MEQSSAVQLLASLPVGCKGSVFSISPGHQAARLREFGLCEGHEVEVLCAGNPMICRLGSCRVGICGKLASEIGVLT